MIMIKKRMPTFSMLNRVNHFNRKKIAARNPNKKNKLIPAGTGVPKGKTRIPAANPMTVIPKKIASRRTRFIHFKAGSDNRLAMIPRKDEDSSEDRIRVIIGIRARKARAPAAEKLTVPIKP